MPPRVGPAEAQPRLLHGVVRLVQRAEHPVADRAQVTAVLLEALGEIVSSWLSRSSVLRCQCIDPANTADVTPKESPMQARIPNPAISTPAR